MTSRNRRKKARKWFTSLEAEANAPDEMRDPPGQRFVAVDIECMECGLHLQRAKMLTVERDKPAEPTWKTTTPPIIDHPETGRIASLYCRACSKASGTIQRRYVALDVIEARLREMHEPDVRKSTTLRV